MLFAASVHVSKDSLHVLRNDARLENLVTFCYSGHMPTYLHNLPPKYKT